MAGGREATRRFRTFYGDLLEMAAWLVGERPTVCPEAHISCGSPVFRRVLDRNVCVKISIADGYRVGKPTDEELLTLSTT